MGLLALSGLSACGGGSTYPGCVGAVRYSDATYREVGFTNTEGTPLNQEAAFATCDTVNRDGVSKALRNTSGSLKVRSLPGYRPDQVIAVQVADHAWSVLVSEDEPRRFVLQMHASGLLNAGED
jgi:hypothetical protein